MAGSSGIGIAMIVAGSAMVGAVHALLPDHWIPFVVLSKARGWDVPRSLAAVAAGGVAHLVSTAALGLLLAYLGAEALARIGPAAELAGAGILSVFGVLLSFRGLRALRGQDGHARAHDHGHTCGSDRAHGHAHGYAHADDRGHDHGPSPGPGGHLLQGAVLGIRPCAEAIPVFLAATAYGLGSSVLAIVAWVLATLGTMLVTVWISLLGLRGVRAEFLARHGELAAGVIILLMGLGAALLSLH